MGSLFFIAAIGLVTFVLAVLVLQDWEFFRQPRQRARGIVFDHRRSTDDGTEFFFAMVRFKASDGRSVEVTDTVGRPMSRPQVGSEVDVVYPVARPDMARVRRPWLRIGLYSGLSITLIFLIVGAIRTLGR